MRAAKSAARSAWRSWARSCRCTMSPGWWWRSPWRWRCPAWPPLQRVGRFRSRRVRSGDFRLGRPGGWRIYAAARSSILCATRRPPGTLRLTTVTRSAYTRPLAQVIAPSLLLLQIGGASLGAQAAPSRGAPSDTLVAIVGATVIDGNGGTPVSDATIVVRGKRITALGPRASTQVPKGARVVDGTGKFITPGFIDTNVPLSLYNNGESMVRYEDRFLDLIAEAAQTELKYGITTVRDSYGALLPLIAIRDSIAPGKLIGPRMLVAGNIVGWGGPKSPLFSNATPATYFDEQMMDFIAQGSGEELLDLSPDELRFAIDKYLDKGPIFVKYGGTAHTNSLITFSPRQQ